MAKPKSKSASKSKKPIAKEAKRDPKPPRDRKVIPLVAIGASAGGIPALKQFFEAMPDNPGIAFAVVLHLSPTHESHLVGVLQRSTKMGVVAVDQKAPIRPNCIYVISPNSVLTITDDELRARQPRTQLERHHPVDALFQSLADHRGVDAACIVLSGSGANGTAGAQVVRSKDGIVLAQDPDTAERPEMPRNVINAGLVDRVMRVEDMPRFLVSYLRGARPVLDMEAEEQLAATAEAELNAILAVLRARGRHDFSPYRKRTLVRRIKRRMGLNQIDSFPHYAEKLRNDPDEVQALLSDLLINVTAFFRDPEAWETLREKVMVPLVAANSETQSVRVWVPACSTGEEAYTLAMMLQEEAERAEVQLDIKVFATDAAPVALARARAGVFPASIVEAIPAKRLERFFDKEDDVYRAKKSLRESVIFAPQNVLADPPFSKLDLISCRNLLIYLEPSVQDKLIALFHFALRSGGYLFLGSAETIGKLGDLFQPISKKWRVFRRVGQTRHDLIDFRIAGTEIHAARALAGPHALPRAPADDAREALLGTFAPPSALIDERNRILYFHGDLDPYVKTPTGEPTLDLLNMVREALRSKLRAAIRQAGKERASVQAETRLKRGGKESVRMTVTPVLTRNSASRFLVSFEELTASRRSGADSRALDPQAISEGQLEEELRAAREELRLSIEQLETSNEELKASNEEITSMNEELQSTNEELETSKEELQSLNEELNTVNSQLQSKVEELEDRTNDLNNLLNSTEIATLFVDQQFRIRWFSPPMRALFQVIQADVGRPITDFAQRFEDAAFVDDAREVMRTLQPREREVYGADGRWHMRRLMPYRTEDNRIDGIVCTFSDVTERKKWEEELRTAKAYAERIVETTRQPMLMLDKDRVVTSANRAFYDTFGLAAQQTIGNALFEINKGDWDIAEVRSALRDSPSGDGLMEDLSVVHDFRDLGRRELRLTAHTLDKEGRILICLEDVTDFKFRSASLGAAAGVKK